jgi:hypothetical protein
MKAGDERMSTLKKAEELPEAEERIEKSHKLCQKGIS